MVRQSINLNMKLMPEFLLKIMFLLLTAVGGLVNEQRLAKSYMHKFTCNLSIRQLVNQKGLRVMEQLSNH